TNLNDFNPDHNRLLWVDKTYLTYYTTEFCFYPTGYYNVESLGRVLTADNKILGQAEIKSVVKLFDIFKQTNQAQFSDSSVISSRSAFGPTYGNKSLQIMPELPEYAKDADYDGYITSATTENSDKSAGAAFRAHFANGVDADSGQAMLPDINGPYKDRLVPTGAKLGKLFPDGIYSEYKSVPEYPYQPPEWDKIMVSVWVKPHFRPEDTERIRWYTSWMGRDQGTWHGTAAFFGIWGIVNGRVTTGQPQTRYSEINSPTQYPYGTMQDDNGFAAGGMGSNPRKHTTTGSPCLNRLGNRSYSATPYSATLPSAPNYFQAGHWMHFAWIRKERTIDILYVNGQTWPYGYDARHLTSGTSLRFSANLRLGQRHDMERYPHPADSTFDEVAIFPLSSGLIAGGGSSFDEISKSGKAHGWGSTSSEPASVGKSIWNDGRYYQGTDGTFTSGEIDLAKESNVSSDTSLTVFLTTWTIYPADTLQPLYPYPAGSNIKIQIDNGNMMEDARGSVPEDYSGGPLTSDKPIRYSAHFKPQVDLNKIVIDSLILDDVTLYYYSEPKLLSWTYVR
ncbi:MAG: hypothetical protein HY762_05440, partial [Planctomycetes bacterium]|nr:hypothetical protein [Planctomycetota bacterium]